MTPVERIAQARAQHFVHPSDADGVCAFCSVFSYADRLTEAAEAVIGEEMWHGSESDKLLNLGAVLRGEDAVGPTDGAKE